MDLISVIVPIYNVEKYLIRCVESIQKQSYSNLEIILVDDSSPDRCPQMCDELAELDSRIKVVHKKNGGLGFARNSGLDVATGKYVTFIDSDDWISETHIENLYKAVVDNSADAVIGAFTTAPSDGMLIPRDVDLNEGVYVGEKILNEIVLPLFGSDIRVSHDSELEPSSCKNLYSMDLINEKNLRFISEREAVSEDKFFNIDYFISSKKIVAINENGYFYFRNFSSISRSYDPQRLDRTINYYHKLFEKAQDYKLENDISYRIYRSFLMKIRVLIRVTTGSNLSFNDKLSEIRRILSSDLVQQVLRKYPTNYYGLFMRVFTWLMKHKCSFGVYLLMIVREKGREFKDFFKKKAI